jgi:hypothetical protein
LGRLRQLHGHIISNLGFISSGQAPSEGTDKRI